MGGVSPAISSSYQDELHLRHSRTRDTVLRGNELGQSARVRDKADTDDKLGTPWSEKIWLGKSEVSDEHSTPVVAVTAYPDTERRGDNHQQRAGDLISWMSFGEQRGT